PAQEIRHDHAARGLAEIDRYLRRCQSAADAPHWPGSRKAGATSPRTIPLRRMRSREETMSSVATQSSTRNPWLVRSLRHLCCAAGLAAAVSLPPLPAQAQEVELKLITGFPFEGPAGDKMYGAKTFIERFNAQAKGKARIRVIGGPEVVSPFDQLKAL